MEANLQPGPLASTSRAWPLPFETLAEGTAPGVGKCLSPPKKGAGGGAPSLIAAEVGRDRSQPPFSAFGADGRGHRQKKKKKKKKKKSVPAARGRAAGGLGVRCQAPPPLRPPCKVLIRNSQH